MSRYKILQLESWAKWLLEPGFESLDELKTYRVTEIEPVFNRDGRYYDRINRVVWFEYNGLAFKEKDIDSFVYILNSLDSRILTTKEHEALIALCNSHIVSKKLYSRLFWEDCHARMIRDIPREAYRFRRTVTTPNDKSLGFYG